MIVDDFSHVDEWGPEKIVTVADPRSGMRGVLVIDNTARGMGKGGTRMSPSLTMPIGTCYLPTESAREGSRFEIDIRGKRVPASVVKMPFYKNATHR